MKLCFIMFMIIILGVLGLSDVATLAQRFDRVDIYMPVYERHILDPIAREMCDVVSIGEFREVGDAPAAAQLSKVKKFRQAWPEKEVMVRTWVGMEVSLTGFSQPIQFGAVYNPDKNQYDFSDAIMRTRTSRAMTETLKHVPAQWGWIDEPIWSYAGLIDPCLLPISSSLRHNLQQQYDHKLGAISDIISKPIAWHDFVLARNQVMTDTLLLQAGAMRRAGMFAAINFIPASLESTGVTAIDMTAIVGQGSDVLDAIHIDPYYTLFAENPRFASFMLALLDDATPRTIPMVGWLDSVDGISERLAIKNPPAISMKTQIAQYLANGCDDLAVWHYVYLKSLKNLDMFAGMVRWLRQHQDLFSCNPRNTARTGLYFSNNTFYLNDFFPRAYTHGIGPYGQYFNVVHTYYSMVCGQIPTRVITVPLGQDYLLAQKLDQLDTLILVEATIMSTVERFAIDQWVRAGGTLVVVGQCGVMDEYKQPQAGLKNLTGVTYTAAENRQEINFVARSPLLANDAVEVEGSCENVYLRTVKSNFDYARDHKLNYDYAEKWPLYHRSQPLGKMQRSVDIKSNVLGATAGIS